MSKKGYNVKRTLYYFWKALMQCKIRTILVLLSVTVWIFVSNVWEPYGVSEILGRISSGDFEIANYVGLLLITLVPVAINNLVVIRFTDWLDWSLDARCGKYLSLLAFDAVINQSMTFHSNRFSGSLTSAANKLPSAFIDLKSNFIWDLFPLTLTIVYSIVVTFFVCAPFALILLLYVIVYMLVAIITYYKTRNVDEALADAENKQTGQLADAITNEVSVKSYAREGFEGVRFSNATERTKRATFNMAKVSF